MDAAVWNGIWPDWQFKNVIGRGAYGVVYRAVRFFEGKEEESAIKVISLPHDEIELEQLRSEGMTEEETQNYYASLANEFYEEIQTMKALNGNVSIVNVQDSAILPRQGEFGWNILIRMECLTPLVEYLDGRMLTEAEVTALGIDLCRALEVCEEHGILHRDIKPENIFVDKEGHFKLGDFGIAKQLEATTGAFTRVGTPFYSAPEVAEGKRYDRRVDIYSLGLVLYRLLNNGLLPFMPEKRLLTPGDRRTALERRLSGETLPPPAGASDRLSRVILKACEPKAKDRYGSAAEFREALDDTQKASVLPWWKRSGVRVAGVILMALLAGGAVYGFASGTLQGSKPVIIPAVSSSSANDSSSSASDEAPVSTEDPVVPSGSPTEESVDNTSESSALTVPTMITPSSEEDPTGTSIEETEEGPSEPSAALPSTTEAPKTTAVPAKLPETTTAPAKPPETAAAHVHAFGEWTVTREPTCTAAGERIRSCNCEAQEKESVAALGHSFSNWTIMSEATCTEAGKQERLCSRCGIAEEQNVPALGHDMADGVCTRCGESVFLFVLNTDGASYTLAGVGSGLDTSKKVVLPNTYKGLPVTQLRDGMFRGYTFSGGLQLPSSLTYIGDSTFHSCRIAGTLVIPGSVKMIAEWAFASAEIDDLVLSEGVRTLKENSLSLAGRPSLKIPSTVQECLPAFCGSYYRKITVNSQTVLDSGEIPEVCIVDTISLGPNINGYTVKNNCLIRTSTSTLLWCGVGFSIPADGSVKIIHGQCYFSGYNDEAPLYTLTIPEGVRRIELSIVSAPSLVRVDLPHSLEYIDSYAFYAPTLKNIFYAGTVDEWRILLQSAGDGWHQGIQVSCTDGMMCYENDQWVQK